MFIRIIILYTKIIIGFEFGLDLGFVRYFKFTKREFHLQINYFSYQKCIYLQIIISVTCQKKKYKYKQNSPKKSP